MKLYKNNLDKNKKNLAIVVGRNLFSMYIKEQVKEFITFLELYKKDYNIIFVTRYSTETFVKRTFKFLYMVDDVLYFESPHEYGSDFLEEECNINFDILLYTIGLNFDSFLDKSQKQYGLNSKFEQYVIDSMNGIKDDSFTKMNIVKATTLNFLLLIKIANKSENVVHILYDPDEINLDTINIDHKRYMFYESEYFNCQQIDNYLYYLQQNVRQQNNTFDFTFGGSFITKERIEYFDKYVNSLEKLKINKQLFFKTKHSNTYINKKEYLDFISKSKYTLVIPAYERKSFSYLRFLESIHFNCIPFITNDCFIEEVFDTDEIKYLQKFIIPFNNLQVIESKIKELDYEKEIKILKDMFLNKNKLNLLKDVLK